MPAFCNIPPVALPLETAVLCQKLKRARDSHQHKSFKDDLLRLWIAVMNEPVEVQTVYNAVIVFFNSLSNTIVSQPSTIQPRTYEPLGTTALSNLYKTIGGNLMLDHHVTS